MDVSMFQIRVPRSTEWTPSVAISCMKALTHFLKDILFTLYVTGTSEGVIFRLTTDYHPSVTQRSLTDLFIAYYPGTEVFPFVRQLPSYPFYRRIMLLYRLGNIWIEPLSPPPNHQRFDPLMVVTQTMTGLQPGESITYRTTMQMSLVTQKQIEELLSISAHEAGWRTRGSIPVHDLAGAAGALMGKIISDWRLRSKRVLRYSEADTERYLTKLRQGYGVGSISIVMDSPYKERLTLVSAVAGAALNLCGSGAMQLGNGMSDERRIATTTEEAAFTPHSVMQRALDAEKFDRFTHYPSSEELSLLWHLPHSGFGDQPIVWTSGLPTQVLTQKANETLQIGTVGTAPVFLNRRDRQYHAYVTGQTGMGKSTIVHNLIHQDITAGQGVAVLDPHGSLISDILAKSIPEERLNDVVLLSCADREYPVPINPFHTPPDIDPDQQLNAVLWLMKTLYADSWSKTRMETTMRNILQLILSDESATPLDIQELIQNHKWRQRLFRRLEKADKLSQSTLRFWKNFDDLSPSERSAQTQPILNRLTGFLGSPHLERITCHPQTLDFRSLIREKKIILIDLSGDVIASEVEMLGAIFFLNIFLAIQSLFFSSKGTAHPFYLYIDEAQRFLATGFPQMFAETRKFGLSLTLANQYIGQLDEETQDAIKNNVGTKVSFECSPEEARLTAKLYEPEVTQQEMTRLGVGHAAIRTRFGGETLNAFIVNTLPPPSPTGRQIESKAVAERSRTNLNLLPVEAVKAWIKKRYEDDEPSQPTELTDFE